MNVSRVSAVGSGLALVALLAGCSLAPGGGTGNESSDEEQPVSTELSDEEVTLTIAFTNAPEMMAEYVAEFEELYPQVTIDAQFTEFASYSKSIGLQMNSSTAPDIAQYNVSLKELIGAGKLLKLDEYREAYGWDDTFPAAGLAMQSFSDDGKIFGTGSLYGVPAAMSETGIFVNEAVAADLGVKLPIQDLKGLEQAMDAALDAGVTPLEVGALDSGALHLWSNLLNVMVPKEDYRDWVNGQPGQDIITGPGAVKATETFADWAKRGYFPKGANANGQAQATANFTQGATLFLLNGTWAATQIDDELGSDAGFFTMPGQKPSAPTTTSGSSVAFMISSGSDHADAAAAFLNYLGSETAAVITSNGGFLPPNSKAELDLADVRADLYSEYSAAVESDGINRFPDSVAPAAFDRMVSGLQALIEGVGDPAEFLAEIQGVRDEYHGK